MNWLWQFLYRHLIDNKIADSELFDAHSKLGAEAMGMMRFSVRIEFWCLLLVVLALLRRILLVCSCFAMRVICRYKRSAINTELRIKFGQRLACVTYS